MFKLSPNEQVTIFPAMMFIHPEDLKGYTYPRFNPFDCEYHTTTGVKVWPLSEDDTHPNLEAPVVGSFTMNQLKSNGKLVHTWKPYVRGLNCESTFKAMHSGTSPQLASSLELPNIHGKNIPLLYCNNMTCTGAVYRTENDDQIYFCNRGVEAEEYLGDSFQEIPQNWSLSTISTVVEKGDWLLVTSQYPPSACEPPTPITLTSDYTAQVVIDDCRWLAGILLTRIPEPGVQV